MEQSKLIMVLSFCVSFSLLLADGVQPSCSMEETNEPDKRIETVAFDGFFLGFKNLDDAISLFQKRYRSCREYARLDLGKQEVVVLRWPVGSFVGLHQYVMLWGSDTSKEGWGIFCALGSMAGEFRFVKTRQSLQMVGKKGVVVEFRINAEGAIALGDY